MATSSPDWPGPYDAIVVGARCAGSPAAILLARSGHRVLQLDRDAFPSHIFRAHVVRLSGAQALVRWGLMDRVLATGCPPFTCYPLDLGDFSLDGAPPLPPGQPREVAPHRKVLNALLVQAAIEAGADFREHASVEDVIWEDDSRIARRGREAAPRESPREASLPGGRGRRQA